MASSPHKKGAPGSYQAISDINVTPMVDVMLVLLIIFMVTAPMMTAGVKITLPQGGNAAQTLPQEPAVVTIDKGGQLFVGKTSVTRDQLSNAVKAKLEGDLSRPVHVRGDKDVNYGEVVSIMDLLATDGIVKIAIVSDRQSRATAPQGPNAGVSSSLPGMTSQVPAVDAQSAAPLPSAPPANPPMPASEAAHP